MVEYFLQKGNNPLKRRGGTFWKHRDMSKHLWPVVHYGFKLLVDPLSAFCHNHPGLLAMSTAMVNHGWSNATLIDQKAIGQGSRR